MIRAIAVSVVLLVLVPLPAWAFCGFYVAGSGESLANDATQVALMRHGTTTVVSMQNSYVGPPEDFAMVVPVAQVLRKKHVKTLPAGLFERLDRLTAPRLVEYWEQDPCGGFGSDYDDVQPVSKSESSAPMFRLRRRDKKVKVEAKFSVGEYDIVVLSATESTALDTWLHQHNYRIPEGAASYLQPYVETGMYFFVARVDADKVTRDETGRTVLSPLRFHYDNADFFLPVRLGMINSTGRQDLVVYTIGHNQRFEVANRPNLFIATNLEVRDEVRNDFGAFYEGVFEKTLAQNPAAIVTEYSWGATGCDPCPAPVMGAADLETLGGDLMPRSLKPHEWVLTRLHARYGADEVGEDLVFTKAPAIRGGNEIRDQTGALETGAHSADYGTNTFQGRYVIRHEWDGAVDCEDPQFGLWGGPPNGSAAQTAPSANTRGSAPASAVAVDVEALIKAPFPQSRVVASRSVAMPRPSVGGGMCAGCTLAPARGSVAAIFLLLGAVAYRRRRR